MAVVKPFVCIRPEPSLAAQVAALPYDVYDRREAKAYVQGRPLSFLNIDRPETQFPDGQDMYAPEVYRKARSLFEEELVSGVFIEDREASYYIYELTMNGRVQTGLVGCCAVSDYRSGVIKKHENTRPEKEQDRIRHIDALSAQTGPIFLAYRADRRLAGILLELKKAPCLCDFTAEDGVRHRVWKAAEHTEEIRAIFAGMDSLYIADGHHRAASACKVGRGEDFLAVLFSADELAILPYNRAVKDLAGLSEEEFLEKLGEDFDAEPAREAVTPSSRGTFGLFLGGRWYRLSLKPGRENDDPVKGLDVSLLQDLVFDRILGITDPKTDPRVSFIGGIRGTKELERLVDTEGYAAAFSMFPTQMDELLRVADAGLLMPPKSTWFEPKLRSGLFIHRI